MINLAKTIYRVNRFINNRTTCHYEALNNKKLFLLQSIQWACELPFKAQIKVQIKIQNSKNFSPLHFSITPTSFKSE